MKTKRILSVLLAAIFLMSTFTFCNTSVSAAANHVYVSAERGKDSNSGTFESPFASLTAAIKSLPGSGGTVYIIGEYSDSNRKYPAKDGMIYIEGYIPDGETESSAWFYSRGGLTLQFSSAVTFRNITLATPSYSHFTTNQVPVTFGEGTKINTQIIENSNFLLHIGPSNEDVNKTETVIVDGSTTSVFNAYIGAYMTNVEAGISGDVNIIVKKGSINLILGADSYSNLHTGLTIGKDLKIFVGKTGAIAFRENGNAARVKGNVSIISEDGANVANIPDNYKNSYVAGDVIHAKIMDPDTTVGTVEHSENPGKFIFKAPDGYAVKYINNGKTYYTSVGEHSLPAGINEIYFVDEHKMCDMEQNVTINTPVPTETVWAASVSDANVNVSCSIEPSHSSVQYSTVYTYNVKLTPKSSDYLFPSDVKVTINGKELTAENAAVLGNSEITFKYVAPETIRDPDKIRVEYISGADDSVGDMPAYEYYLPSETFDVGANPYTRIGYAFIGFSDGENTYQPGDTYIAGNADVTFTAQWEKLVHLEYVKDAGCTGTAQETGYYHKGTSIVLASSPFVRIGYEFSHYIINGTVYNPGDAYVLNEDTEVKFVWNKLAQFKVKFDADFPTTGTAPKTMLVYNNAKIIVPENTTTKLGFKFEYWVCGSEKYYPGDIVTVTGDMTLTAYWADSNEGTVIYLDADNGKKGNDGLSIDTPIESLATAKKILGSSKGIIAVIGKLTIDGELPDFEDMTVITGYDDKSELVTKTKGAVIFKGPVTIKGINMSVSMGVTFVSNGNKIVLGENVKNTGSYKITYCDGLYNVGTAASVKLDTTVKNGFDIGEYYIGGANITSSEVTIEDGSSIIIDGGTIDKLYFGPRYSNDDCTEVSVPGGLTVNVLRGSIGAIEASEKVFTTNKKESSINLIFSNYSYKNEITDSVAKKINKNNNFFIIDLASGGEISYAGTKGRFSINKTPYYTAAGKGKYSKKTSSTLNAALNSGKVLHVRFGDPDKTDVNITLSNIAGGANKEILTITSNTGSPLVTDWTPCLTNNYFDYDTVYTAKISIYPEEGKWYSNADMPTVTINGVVSQTSVNGDGSLSAEYTFEKTESAPAYTVTFESGDSQATGKAPSISGSKWKHLSSNKLPQNTFMITGKRFIGWIDNVTGELYRAGSQYTYTNDCDTTFTASWQTIGDWVLPNVLVLFDLSRSADESGRNPVFALDAGAVSSKCDILSKLNSEVSGSNTTENTRFDSEDCIKIVPDESESMLMLDIDTLSTFKCNAGEYKYVTLVYYYKSEYRTANGEKGVLQINSFKNDDGTLTEPVEDEVKSIGTISHNKWRYLTFDLTEVLKNYRISDSAIYDSISIYPLGKMLCNDLPKDELYLKTLILSKSAPKF